MRPRQLWKATLIPWGRNVIATQNRPIHQYPKNRRKIRIVRKTKSATHTVTAENVQEKNVTTCMYVTRVEKATPRHHVRRKHLKLAVFIYLHSIGL